MARIGFIREEVEEVEETEHIIEDVDQEFSEMIHALEIEESLLRDQLQLDQRIREALVRLHIRLKELEKKIRTRTRKLDLCKAKITDFPQQSLSMINEIMGLDREILQEAGQLSADIAEHSLPDVADLYKEIEVSKEQIKKIRLLSNTLGHTLNSLSGTINEEFHKNYLEQLRRRILARNPSLAK